MLHPRLYKKDTKGKTRFWQIETDEQGSYRSIAGELGGNPVTSGWTVCTPKNEGRANQTTAIWQCEREVAALYTKKRDKHYVDSADTVEDERKYFEVMLAATYDEKTKKLLFKDRDLDIFVQPKLDGVRGPVSVNGVISRNGKRFWAVDFIREALAPIFTDYPHLVFDGELYNHEYADDFNEIISTIKNGGSSEQVARAKELVQLHVYDLYDPTQPDLPFHERNLRLRILLSGGRIGDQEIDYGLPAFIKIVPTHHVETFEELDKYYEEFLEAGYEGQMIRFDHPYQHKRTKSLLKRKETITEEFEIIRIEEGKGNWAGYAKRIYVKVPRSIDGESKGGIKGTQAYLHGVLREADEYVGGTATMEFFGYTPDGKLRFGRAARLYKGKRDD